MELHQLMEMGEVVTTTRPVEAGLAEAHFLSKTSVERELAEERARLERIREIMTCWNFGPLSDREALSEIFKVVGDCIQGSPT